MWSLLQAPANIIRQGNEDVLTPTKYPDTDLVNLNLDTARFHVALDVQQALGLLPNDMAGLDAAATYNEPLLQKAISYKQLEFFYAKVDEGEGSKSRLRLEFYRREYGLLKAQFASLLRQTQYSVVAKTILR